MQTDPQKYDGKVKEQVDMEFKARRNYPRKWLKFYNETPWQDMYNPDKLSKQIKEQMKTKDLNPYKYTSEGDGHFVSPGMYNSLLAKCRCGRPHSDVHLLRCLQKEQSKYLENGNTQLENDKKEHLELPKTSNAFVGWHTKQPIYKQWEESIKYKSPIYDMPGERITTTPYNAIIIG
ncbi:uncharacterized protein LOC101887438 [Musca domestica]|uniref:Uncharacterized protein LOC101887438 n=1 Tax=Musca domestica TaxID=7370 RepID=A0A1I8MZP4_MUSDO|nr:uncharacterized protein LOC101887438 [Musca domestica]